MDADLDLLRKAYDHAVWVLSCRHALDDATKARLLSLVTAIGCYRLRHGGHFDGADLDGVASVAVRCVLLTEGTT